MILDALWGIVHLLLDVVDDDLLANDRNHDWALEPVSKSKRGRRLLRTHGTAVLVLCSGSFRCVGRGGGGVLLSVWLSIGWDQPAVQ